MSKTMNFYVYIAKCSDGTFYTGYTTDIKVREKEHNGLGKPGAKYTRSRRPVKIIHIEKFNSKSLAMKREIEIKKLNHEEKVELVSGD